MKVDVLYIKFQEGKFAKNKKIDKHTMIDLDAKGRLTEVLNMTRKVLLKQ